MPAHGDPTCAPRTDADRVTVHLTAEQADHVRAYVLGQINADLDTGVLARDFTGIEDIERLRDILWVCVRDLGALGEKGTPVDYTASRDCPGTDR
jgi:hypothetical protein